MSVEIYVKCMICNESFSGKSRKTMKRYFDHVQLCEEKHREGKN